MKQQLTLTENVEKVFYQLLHELSVDKIVIFATHNLEELEEADVIIDLNKFS